ncbi:hypothetical protein AB1Y20_006033 [Prymnesium parvum]
MAAALKTNTTLTSLLLSDNRIGAEGAKDVAVALKINTTLTSLHLRGNSIGAEGAREVAAALKANTTLTSLLLSDNAIGDVGAREVAAALEANTTLTTLHLSGNRIGDEAARDLAAMLKTNKTLTSLYLRGNVILAEGGKEVFVEDEDEELGDARDCRAGDWPREMVAGLLDLIHDCLAKYKNRCDTHAAMQQLVMLERTHGQQTAEEAQLQAVRVELERLRTEAQVAAMQPGQQKHTCLVCFDDFPLASGVKCIADVDAHFVCADCLEGYVREVTSDGNLWRLEAQGQWQGIPCPGVGCTASPFTEQNRIGSKGANEVAAALKTNTSLTSLYLNGNLLNLDAVTAMAGALKNNTTLTSLHLGGLRFHDEIQAYLGRNDQAPDLLAEEEGPRKKPRLDDEQFCEAAAASAAGGLPQGEAGGSQDDPVSLARALLASCLESHDAAAVDLPLPYLRECTNDFHAARQLGEGAFGQVFRAVDAVSGMTFAVKRLDRAFLAPLADPTARAAQLRAAAREVEVLSRFRHPHIVRLLGYAFAADGDRCLVYPLLAGGSLDAALREDARAAALTWRVRLRIASGLAKALNYLHRGGSGAKCYHRDVKAANVCLTAELTPQLIDCGLAKFVPDDAPAATSTGGRFGTPGYQCPRYVDNGKFDSKSEAYSLGIVLLELLVGERARDHILERILTLACPGCGQAFIDFEGCFAIYCGRCSTGFCAYCLKNCGEIRNRSSSDAAHRHVAQCQYNATGELFSSQTVFETAQRQRRRRELDSFLSTLSAEDAARALCDCDRELRDLGLV